LDTAPEKKDHSQDPKCPVAVATPASPLELLIPAWTQASPATAVDEPSDQSIATESLTLEAANVVEADPADAHNVKAETAFAVRMLESDAAPASQPAVPTTKPEAAPAPQRTLETAPARPPQPAPDAGHAEQTDPQAAHADTTLRAAPIKEEADAETEPRESRSDARPVAPAYTTKTTVETAVPAKVAAAEAPAAVAEPDAPSAVRPAAARDIALHLTDANHQRVDVRLVETAGEVRVVARTADADLTRGLRNGLSELLNRLEHNGYQAEIWRPSESSFGETRQESRQQNAQHNFGGGGSHPDGGRGHSRGGGQSRQPQWVEEMERLFGSANRLEGDNSHGYIR
jgi:hypothetical protein